MSSVRKRVLVTGGAGFFGSHLCERLIARGDDCFEAMRHDITHPIFVEVDEIYNLACPASPIHYQFDPVQTTKTRVIGAINNKGAGNGFVFGDFTFPRRRTCPDATPPS